MQDEEISVSRKVYFFRIEHFDDIRDRIPGAIQKIENLPFDDRGRYQIDALTKSRLCAFPDRLEYPIRLRFGRTRRDQLPDIEREGKLKTLELREDEGLIDVCHIVIFEDGYVASEFNHDGPRISKLGHYLFEKGQGLPTAPKFLPLFERDILEVITKLDNIRVVELEVPPDLSALIREADDNLAAAVQACANAGASKKVSLSLTSDMGTTKLRSVAERLASLIKSRPTERGRFNTLKATGYFQGSSIPRYVDILEDKLVAGEIFRRTSSRSRSIDSDYAYKLIEEAYYSRKEKINLAAWANDPW